MSHIPLLAKTTVPKLHPPRRAPQVACLCLLAGLALLLMPSGTFPLFMENATHSTHSIHSIRSTYAARTRPPPAALQRVIQASTQHRFVTEDTLQDLLATVSYFAEQELNPR